MTTDAIAQKRQAARDSLFLSTEIAVAGARKPVSVRVRNLSPGGMMVDGSPLFHEGAAVSADLRGIGAIAGTIAWVAEGRAGVAFDTEIDPKQARHPVGQGKHITYARPPVPQSTRPGLKLR